MTNMFENIEIPESINLIKQRKREVRAIANFLLELQGNAEDAMALVSEGDFDEEFVAMLEQDINEIAEEFYND